MRKELTDLTIREFETRLASTAPAFRRTSYENRDAVIRMYACEADGVRRFLLLQCDKRENAFTIEVAWSKGGDYPFMTFMAQVPALEANVPAEGRLRLLQLSVADAKHHWWKVSDSVIGRLAGKTVQTQMEDAFAHLANDGLPYLEKVSRRLISSSP